MSTVIERTAEQLSPVIPSTMQAVVCYGPEDYRLETVDVPTPGPDEILTKVELCGICMGDIKTYRGAPSFWGDAEQPRYVKPPMIPGHEFVCRVVALGPGAEKRGVQIGDRVISEQIVPCWGCRFCNHGQYWMCQKHDLYGFQNNVQGAMAQYMIFTKEGIIHKVPDSIAPDEAILIEPLACSLHAAERANVDFDDIVVVAGAGTLGLAMLRKLGRFVEFSVFNDEATVDWSIIGDRKELDVLGSHLGPYMSPRAIDFIGNRKIDMRDVVTHKFPLAEFKEAFAVMERGDKSLKVVLQP
ncbi:Zinc-containing alcohol dehydrogenase superfamily protein [Pseudomonas savastanoi pv. phaseolicola]|uniref:alcohol dehydrogenase catalytic domain-containing protein n=1 Tax=Pseudomonas savastanoi TaxID=29438 RepID=UPI0006B8F6BA|nr:alcohol dehydrogenase catalytic domain-containing protein [Pseudomonas savastanoi]KPB42866.1 Zinc-containing alcohol dehydrogenase superfamily protein [Pseudomonas savastanoi pv. phaseolicola]